MIIPAIVSSPNKPVRRCDDDWLEINIVVGPSAPPIIPMELPCFISFFNLNDKNIGNKKSNPNIIMVTIPVIRVIIKTILENFLLSNMLTPICDLHSFYSLISSKSLQSFYSKSLKIIFPSYKYFYISYLSPS